jgi:cyclic beta-1,2-glucan synthetase
MPEGKLPRSEALLHSESPIRAKPLGADAVAHHFQNLGRLSSSEHLFEETKGRILLAGLNQRLSDFERLRRSIAESTKVGASVGGAVEWLKDNDAILAELARDLANAMPPGFYQELPQLRNPPWRRLPRVYRLAFELIAHTDSAVDQHVAEQAAGAFQRSATLSSGELWAFPIMLRLALFDNLVRLMARTQRRLDERDWARRRAQQLLVGAEDARLRRAMENARVMGAEAAQRSPAAAVQFLDWLDGVESVPGGVLQAAHDGVESAAQRTARELARDEQMDAAADQVSIGNVVTSLRVLAAIDWSDFFERMSAAEEALRRDPAGVYPRQDFQTRDRTRHIVESIAKRVHIDEESVVDAALKLAADSPSLPERYVGYWFIGSGLKTLEAKLGMASTRTIRLQRRLIGSLRAYLGGIAAISILVCLTAGWLAGASGWWWLLVFAAAIIPASEIAVGLVNALILATIKPKPLAKFDFSETVDAEAATLIVIPTLLTSKGTVRTLLERLEVHYLSNRDDHFWFALATDFADAPQQHMPEDDAILSEAREGIKHLNLKYSPSGTPRFFLFHRKRMWNPAEGVWMGWERKRGKLSELNRILRGDETTTYIETTVPVASLPRPTFVLTLDADTQLPLGAARKLVGAAAHPLNRPHFDSEGRIVGGYALFQPRVNLTLLGSKRSMFTRIYAGSAGIDPYSVAASDVYQDFFESGSFVGKGLYHLDAFESLTHDAFPENAILSHDLIESNFARCALVSDVQLLDDFPTNFHVFIRREHRWVRGDWQLLPWLGRRIPDAAQTKPVEHPPVPGAQPRIERRRPTVISDLGRWKMFDNLRRSLTAPAAALLLVLGWTILPGSPWLWNAVALVGVFWPFVWLFLRSGVEAATSNQPGWLRGRTATLADTAASCLVEMVFLLERAKRAVDAIVRTLYRMYISRRHLLEWQTAASTEKGFTPTFINWGKSIWFSPFAVLVIAGTVVAGRPESLPAAFAPLMAWALAPFMAWWTGRHRVEAADVLASAERRTFSRVARRTWAFFETYVGDDDNHLPPDNFQEDPKGELAHRTSPTNIGLYLLANVAAHDLGYLSLAQMATRLRRTFDTIDRLERHFGHLVNWYDTQSLEPLPPRYISTVDSGNFLGCLLTLAQALEEKAQAGDDPKLILAGVRDTVEMLLEDERIGKDSANAQALRRALELAEKHEEIDFEPLVKVIARLQEEATDLPVSLQELGRQLAAGLPSVDAARKECLVLAQEAEDFAEAMDFTVVYNPTRDLFAIGRNLGADRLDNAHYDLLASEACLTSFLAIARGQAPSEHWFQLGRPFCGSRRNPTLVSWGGTMFEYLMPRLLLRSFPETTLDESHRNAVTIQQEYGASLGVPWGISESAYNVINSSGDYQYQAFGVPALALKRMGSDLVVSPYASALAAGVAPSAVAANFRELERIGAFGTYGFCESVDFTKGRNKDNGSFALVRTYMAHHQGMTLIALTNALLTDVMPRRLAANPAVRAAEVLLQERVPEAPLLLPRSAVQEEEPLSPAPSERQDVGSVRRIATPFTAFPRSHLLSNGRYSVMITNAGGGYSTWQGVQVTRWREDRVKDHWGQFLYLQDLESGRTYSATCQPLGLPADDEEISFASDKATFRRQFRDLEIRLEVAVAPGDDVELRRVVVINRSNRTRRFALKSYVELAMTSKAADIAHPAFQKLFVETEKVGAHHALLCRRRPRSQEEETPFAFHVVALDRRQEDVEIQWETDRRRFLGRGCSVRDPACMAGPLSGATGPVLDPIFSLRCVVEIGSNATWTSAFSTGVAATRDAAIGLIDRFDDLHAVDQAFDFAFAHAQEERRRSRFSPEQAQLFQRLTAQILFAGLAFRADTSTLAANRLGRRDLWRHGISGDLPIVLARISHVEHLELAAELVDAFIYWNDRSLEVDLVFLDEMSGDYRDENFHRLQETILARGGAAHSHRIRIVRRDHLSPDDVVLIRAAARCEFIGGQGSLEDQTAERERRLQAYDRRLRPRGPKLLPSQAEVRDLSEFHPAPTIAMEYRNLWGGFINSGKEYAIELDGATGMRTPAPWSNVIANPVFGCLADDGGLGYTWAGNAQLNRVTTWSNDPVSSPPPEIVYICDEETDQIWSATPAPTPARSIYRIRHGFGRSIYQTSVSGIDHELEVFVDADDPLKYMVLTLKNRSSRARRLRVGYYAELTMGLNRDVEASHVVTELEPVTGALLARNVFESDFANGWAFANVDARPRSFTCDRNDFIGRLGSEKAPAALRGKELSGAIGPGLDPCFALVSHLVLPPGEERQFVFTLGRGESREAAERLAARCRDASAIAKARSAVSSRWRAFTQSLQVETPDRAFDILVNGWLLHQVVSSRLWGRTGFYQSGGAFGFRDQLQDAMALALAAPWETRAHLLRAAARQFVEGDVQHWWHMPSGAGVRTKITDDLLWLPLAVCHYVEATGDTGVLDEQVPFISQPPLEPDQEDAYRVPDATGEAASLFEHCVRAITFASGRDGPHGLPLIGTGDWNDGMNRVGAGMKGESIWNAWFQVVVLEASANLAGDRDASLAADYRERARKLREAVETHAWDGEWYLRAFFDDGTPLGAATATECAIDVLPQAWAAIAGGRSERVDQALNAAKQRLIDERHRLVKLFAPPFDTGPLQPGYIKGYIPGIRENGGQYTHGAVWLAWAETVRGNGDEAMRVFNLLNPIRRSGSHLERYAVEPYVMAGDVYGAPPHEGRGGWTWYTGSAAWMYRLAVEQILGIRRRGNHLEISPCLPSSWDGYSATLAAGKSMYNLKVEVSEVGEHRVEFDGKPLKGDVVPFRDDGRAHSIRVLIVRPSASDGQMRVRGETGRLAQASGG